jgi:hypothetical protein
MNDIGTIINGKKLGYTDKRKYKSFIYSSCPDCGRLKWLEISYYHKHDGCCYCYKCSIKYRKGNIQNREYSGFISDKQPIVWGIDTRFDEEQIIGCMLCNNTIYGEPREIYKNKWYVNGITMYRGNNCDVKFALCQKHNTMENQIEGWKWAKEGLLNSE